MGTRTGTELGIGTETGTGSGSGVALLMPLGTDMGIERRGIIIEGERDEG